MYSNTLPPDNRHNFQNQTTQGMMLFCIINIRSQLLIKGLNDCTVTPKTIDRK